jgi:hypothetical protein
MAFDRAFHPTAMQLGRAHHIQLVEHEIIELIPPTLDAHYRPANKRGEQ